MLPPDTVRELEAAGLFEMMTPAIYGGRQSGVRTYMDAVAELGRGDVSVAWSVALISICNWMTATLFPKAVADAVFATPGGARIAGVLSPRVCKARRVEGGIVVDEGFWGFNSGIYHANWDLLGVPIFNEAGEQIDQGLAIVPIADVEIVGDWDTIAIRGSGSSSVRMRGVFIPDARIASVSKAIQGDYASKHLADIPLYRAAFIPMLAIILTFPILGGGSTGLELFLASLPKRAIQYTFYAKQGEAAVTHLQVSEASAKIDAAYAIVARAVLDIETSAASQVEGRGEYMDYMTRARIRRDTGFAGRLVWEAVDQIASAAGGSLAGVANPINRVWRDIRIANGHGVVCTETNFELFGRLLCGQEANTPLV
jgi:alkylation response protein AidB-like acyl-CoA dehydrogenase